MSTITEKDLLEQLFDLWLGQAPVRIEPEFPYSEPVDEGHDPYNHVGKFVTGGQ